MRLLLSLLLLFGALPARAATGLSTPVFTNFFQEHFIVAPNAPPTQIIKSRIFGPATNIFNQTTNIYNNSYILYTNSDIFYGDVTLVVSNSIVTNINTTIVNDFTTNIIDNSVVIITNTTFIINGHTNDITQLWRTNAAGIYLPAITNTSTIVVGQSAEAWWAPTLADGFVSIHDASVGDSQFNSLAIAAIDNVLQENYGTFTSTLGSGAAPAGAMQLLAATNWQNPSAPFSKFSVALQPAYGEVLLDLMNNGVHEFAVSNQITSVQALQLTPLTNVALALGVNQVNVQSNSYIALSAVNSDPTTTEAQLSTGLRDGMLLLLQNIGVLSGFTLYNGTALYDDITKFVTLSGGNWATTNYGDGLLLIGGLNGWSEVGRFTQNTNVQTAQLWELVSGHMRTVPDTLDDWQFRYGGVPQFTISTNGGLALGANSTTWWGGNVTDGTTLVNYRNTTLGDPNQAGMDLLASSSPTDADYAAFHLAVGTNIIQLTMTSATNTTDNAIWNILAHRVTGQLSFSGTYGGTNFVDFQPTIVDAPSATAYTLDTVYPITDPTARLLVLGNLRTNQLSFGPDARITFGDGATNVLYRSQRGWVFSNPDAPIITITNTISKSIELSVGSNPRLAAKGQTISVQSANGVAIERVEGNPIWYFGVGSTDNLLTATDGVGDIGGTANNRPANVKVTTSVWTPKVIWNQPTNTVFDLSGLGSPSGVVTADVGSIYRQYDSTANTGVWVKQSGIGTSTGWAPLLTTSGSISATNGIIQQVKDSFSTNYVIGSNTNQQFFLLNGTNQLVTLPTASGVKDIIYRFSMTNGLGSFVITNAADGAKIRDGVSLSYTNIGVNEVGFMSDGSNWWLASKGKQIFPSASWSLGNTITPVQDVITNIPFTQLEFNNSQGIALRTKAGFTGATELAITNAGTYLITFSAVLKGSGGGSVISIWLRKDGVDVPRTRTDQGFTGATAQQCMTVNFFVQVGTTPSYFELCAASHDASPPTIVSAAANPTGYTAPAMPGVIVTINRVSDTWP